MVNYETLLDEIVSQMSVLTGLGVSVVKMPEIESDYNRPVSSARCLIMYVGSDFGNELSTNRVIQDETVNIGVEVAFKKLYGANGVFDVINKVNAALLGFQPSNTTHGLKIKNYSVNTDNLDRGIWRVHLFYYTTTPSSEAFSLPVDPTLQQITINQNL
jgi:hypothetical protein